MGGPEHPPKLKKNIFSKAYHFLWGLSFPEPFLYLICNKIKYFQIFLKIFGILLRILLNKTGPKMAKWHVSWLDSYDKDRALKLKKAGPSFELLYS